MLHAAGLEPAKFRDLFWARGALPLSYDMQRELVAGGYIPSDVFEVDE